MSARSRSAARWRFLAVVGLLTILTLAPLPALADDGLAPGTVATVTAGEATLIRTAPGFEAASAGEVWPGSQVTILDWAIAAGDGSLWYPVDAGGYLPAYALSAAGAGAPAQPAAETTWTDPNAAPPAETTWTDPNAAAPAADTTWTDPNAVLPAAAPIGTAWIAGTNGEGAACRAAADWNALDLGWLAEGTAVEVTGGTVGEWQPVNCNGVGGFVHASFISWDPNATALNPPVAETWSEPAPAADAGLTVPAEEQTKGRRRGGGNDGGGGGNAGGSGQAVADFALQYVGYPYVYAGAGPNAFDCTGFTMYVVQQTLGMNISHDAATQYGMGTPVGRGQLQPGDLVFFANTFAPGLSHAGIYVGGGQFVHAENESTGVVVSDVNSDYYSSHWYGAVRLV